MENKITHLEIYSFNIWRLWNTLLLQTKCPSDFNYYLCSNFLRNFIPIPLLLQTEVVIIVKSNILNNIWLTEHTNRVLSGTESDLSSKCFSFSITLKQVSVSWNRSSIEYIKAALFTNESWVQTIKASVVPEHDNPGLHWLMFKNFILVFKWLLVFCMTLWKICEY